MMIENFFKATYLMYPNFDYESKAYLEMQDPLDRRLLSVGTDKYTDRPVAVMWSNILDMWVEVPTDKVTEVEWNSKEQKWMMV